ncbi:unnamed protein product [Rhizoctonia solani]|uniref:Uncharacterized protein n=1 Tax=Rhizoctonia solani TaxID=456999 RepID=A0A8H2WLU2_9AGAM|nr:unnamed protein product [Rhizoctonia solani]
MKAALDVDSQTVSHSTLATPALNPPPALVDLGLDRDADTPRLELSTQAIAPEIETDTGPEHKKLDSVAWNRTIGSLRILESSLRSFPPLKSAVSPLIGCLDIVRTTLLRNMFPVDDAKYDSGYSTSIKRRACTAKTREAVLETLQSWTTNPESTKIYWMNGMAGTACPIFPAFRSKLCVVLNDDPDAGKLNVAQQFEMLVNQPMLDAKDAMPDSVVIVIDALDEHRQLSYLGLCFGCRAIARVWDAVLFSTELGLLEVRLDKLDRVADRFFLLEINCTVTGLYKQPILQDARLKPPFARFRSKTAYQLHLGRVPNKGESPFYEQRLRMTQLINSTISPTLSAPPLVIILDVDEITAGHTIELEKKHAFPRDTGHRANNLPPPPSSMVSAPPPPMNQLSGPPPPQIVSTSQRHDTPA